MVVKKRILIVDDDFEVALFLRTAAEMTWPEHEVISVPSAEEGMLELGPAVHLLVTDLRLPGIDGEEFIVRVRRKTPDLPIIVISGTAEPTWHDRAKALGLAGFFSKPLDVDAFIRVARRALEETPPSVQDAPPTAAGRTPSLIYRLLNRLRVDTGAHYVMLVDLNGRSVVCDGQVSDLEMDQVAALLAKEMAVSFDLAAVLNAPQPFTISYQAGAVHDLYAANVGGSYLVALVFDSRHNRGRIGAVWFYARRAVKELLPLLRPAAPPPAEEPEAIGEAAEVEVSEPPPSGTEQPVIEMPRIPAGVIPQIAFGADEVDAFWDRVLEEERSPASGSGVISLEDARAHGLVPADFGLR